MAVLAGLDCSFLAITAEPDHNLMNPDGVELASIHVVHAGVLCDESEFYDPDDKMWYLSQLFFYVSTALGGTTTLMAWAISTCWAPTLHSWRALSILSSITAVFEILIFLIFETESCISDITRQKCSLDLGSYFLISSVFMWVSVTLWTQFLDPPRWSDESNAWVISKRTTEGLESDGTDGSSEREGSPFNQQSHAAPQAFFVSTRNDDGLAIWPVGIDEQRKADDHDDMSSVSDESVPGEPGEGKDVEKGKNRSELTRVRPTYPNDTAIREGAVGVIDSLQTSDPENETVDSPQPSNTGNSRSPNSRKKQEMRNSALIDSDISNRTEHGPGLQLAIACLDVTQEDTVIGQLSSCFVNEVKLPYRQECFGDDARMHLNQVSSPEETPTTVGTEEFNKEKTSITPSKQCSHEAKSIPDSEPTLMKDTISILEDLAKTPHSEMDMQA